MRSLHIVAGLAGLASGAVALSARKGARLHRWSGMVFVHAMLFMSGTGALLAAAKSQRISVIAGLLTFYLVATALLTVRRRIAGLNGTDLFAMLAALGLGIASLRLGFEALDSATGRIDGLPAAAGFILGTVALLAALGDARMMLGQGIHGAERIARHLWRMCFALLIATASFFLTQVGPEPHRKGALPAIPVLAVLLLMLYWLTRVLLPRRNRRRGNPAVPARLRPFAPTDLQLPGKARIGSFEVPFPVWGNSGGSRAEDACSPGDERQGAVPGRRA